MTTEPIGALTIRVVPMPADTNANGDIFGGWVMSRMDQAGGIAAAEKAQGRVVTVAVDANGISVHNTGPAEWEKRIREFKIPVAVA